MNLIQENARVVLKQLDVENCKRNANTTTRPCKFLPVIGDEDRLFESRWAG